MATSDTYTVLHRNDALRSGRYVGTFRSYGEAEAHVLEQVGRTRDFMMYEVWTGTPRNPGRRVGSRSWRGEK